MTYLKVFTDFRELMEPLDHAEKGRLFEAMLRYAEDSTEPVLEGNERFVWAMARRIIDREAEVYQEKVNSAGRARASRWKQPSDTRGDAQVSESASLVSDKENENEYDKEHEKEEENLNDLSKEYVCMSKGNAPSPAGTHIPEREEIESYCRERGNGIDPDYFYDYYAATGWQVGQHPIRDWQALIRAWEKRDAQKSAGPGPIADTVQNILDMAQRKRRDRQRNTLLNYDEKPSHARIEEISLDLNEL